MVKVTVKELCSKFDIEYPTGMAIIKLMIKQGVAKEVDKIKSPSGKGKPSSVYELPETFTLNLV